MEHEEGGEEAIVDIGAHITNILVHERGVTRFVRILPSRGTRHHLRDRAELRGRGRRRGAPEARRGRSRTAPPRRGPPRGACSGPQTSWTRCGPRSSSTRRRRAGRRIGRVLVIGGGSKLDGLPGAPAGARSRPGRTRATSSAGQVPTLALGRRSPRRSRCWRSRSAWASPGGISLSQVNLLRPRSSTARRPDSRRC